MTFYLLLAYMGWASHKGRRNKKSRFNFFHCLSRDVILLKAKEPSSVTRKGLAFGDMLLNELKSLL